MARVLELSVAIADQSITDTIETARVARALQYWVPDLVSNAQLAEFLSLRNLSVAVLDDVIVSNYLCGTPL